MHALIQRTFTIALLVAASLAPAMSAYQTPRNQTLYYAVEITERFRGSFPWTGTLTIKVNDDGIVSGQYRSNSIRPDPFRGQISLVSGGVSGNYIRLSFGASGRLTARGTVSQDKIVGSFYGRNNTIYDFVAYRVKPD